jgi:glutamate racemase
MKPCRPDTAFLFPAASIFLRSLQAFTMNGSQLQNQSSLPIAIFDSGIGGLSVLCEALKILPSENYIYFADTEHVPYGNKGKEEVKSYVLKAGEFLNTQKIKMLVVACNTATSSAIAELRRMYNFPVVGMEPAVKPAVSVTKNKRVLVLATELTLKEQKFRELVDKVDNEKIVDMLPLPELVLFAEQFVFDEDVIIPVLRDKLATLNLESYGTVVLGCTHFPFYKSAFKKIFPEGTEIIDGNKGTVSHIKNILERERLINPKTEKGMVSFFQSGKAVTDRETLLNYRKVAGI